MMRPPYSFLFLMMADAAGVASTASWPTYTFLTPFAAAILMMIWAASLLNHRPSPPRTMLSPLSSSPRALNRDWTQFAR